MLEAVLVGVNRHLAPTSIPDLEHGGHVHVTTQDADSKTQTR